MSKAPIASIIILTHNRLEHTRACLESIFAKTDAPDFEVIVVDNASSDGTPQFLTDFQRQHENVRVIFNSVNLGFASGNNMGAEAASGDYLVFLNNDTLVTPGWLAGLIEHLQDPALGMVGPVTNSAGNQARINVDYTDLEMLDNFALRYTQQHAGETFEIDMLAFFCLAMRRSVFTEVGPLDERFGIGMFEDDDYALRVRQRGYKLLCAEDVFVHHVGSASFSQMNLSAYWHLFDLNRANFEQKWGLEWQPHLYRPELVRQQVRELVDGASWHVAIITEQQGRLDELQRRQAELQARLDEIYDSTAFQLVTFIWKVSSTLAPQGSTRSVILRRSSRSVRSLLNRWGKAWKWLASHRMNWYSYSFDIFKRARHRFARPQLASIRCPSEPGLVSIVLPVYNGEDYLQEALDSILQQSYPNFELIVVDDGSTDESPRILTKYAQLDPRLRIHRQENQRLPRALSNGFKLARGEFLTWTSADNRLKPDFLGKLVDCLQRNPNWDMVYANQDIIATDGKPLVKSEWFKWYQDPPSSEHIMLPVDTSELNVYANNYVGGAFMYRQRVDHLLGDYSPWRFGTEDYDYWMRVNALLNLRHADFNEPVYDYRFHSASLTSRDEEMGITRNRVRLMTFENFRRDFYLSPLAWHIDVSGGPEASMLADQIRAWVASSRHVLLDQFTLEPDQVPELWFPVVYLQVVDDLTNPCSPPADLLPAALKVLIAQSPTSLPGEIDAAWDLCLSTAALDGLPRLKPPLVGWLSIPDLQALCTAVDIRARAAHLSRIEAAAENPSPTECKISVVVCTYHRGQSLAVTLQSVARQSFPPDDYEVLVVNNDPMDTAVDDVVDALRRSEYAGKPDHLRLLKCPLKGLSHARNAGISAARGEVISFLDDDAFAQPDWLEQVWLAFKTYSQAGVVGGKIILDPPDPTPRWLKPGWEKYWSHYNPGYLETTLVRAWWEFPWGANWSARREALFEIGGFRANYGRKGSDFGGGEELIAALLIQGLGYDIAVNPAAVVLHTPDSLRYSFKHVWRTIMAGKRNEYNLQVDLYLPMALSLGSFLRKFIHNLSFALLRRNLHLHQRIERLMYIWADFLLLLRYIRDAFIRFRRPFVLENLSKK